MTPELSVKDAYRGKTVLLTGASGFVGKVWLTMLLDYVPEVGRVVVHMRPKALVSARARFEKMVNTSPGFRPLRERHGEALGRFLLEHVEVVEGELTEPALGMDPETAARLAHEVDLVVHCAGLVDFNPELPKAIASNVDATLNVADFVERCDDARLLHVSTAYVAGDRYGHVRETLVPDYRPHGGDFDAEAELAQARAASDAIVHEHADPKLIKRIEDEVEALVHEQRRVRNPKLVATLVRRKMRESQRQALVDVGMERAKEHGWPNTYTYTKSLTESLLMRRAGRIRMTIARPSIVESAVDFPFAGWNESFNGTAPLAYVMGTWFRAVPARPDAPFDVVPVDLVCRAFITIGAALLLDRAAPVYHVGTSDKHRLSVGRAAELIVLAHRRHNRERGTTTAERVLKTRWDAVLVEPRSVFGLEAQRGLVQGWLELLDMLPTRLRERLSRTIARGEKTDRRLAQIENMCDLYLPFMYESFHVFECRAIDAIPPVEPELAFAPERIDWRRYWIETHVPGLRRWAFPLIEGKRPPRDKPAHPVRYATVPPPESVLPRRHGIAEVAAPQRTSAGEA
jgi:long-chain acyl-CoA synthetase